MREKSAQVKKTKPKQEPCRVNTQLYIDQWPKEKSWKLVCQY